MRIGTAYLNIVYKIIFNKVNTNCYLIIEEGL